jgi:hypothetical protein
MPDAAEQTQEQLDAEWPHICDVFKMKRIPAALAALIDQNMKLAAARRRVNLEAGDTYERRTARRVALLEIMEKYK